MSEEILEQSNHIIQPRNLKKTLYKHQLINVFNMETMEREKKKITDSEEIYFDFGINADATGYGKTITMIALILRNKMEWDINTEYKKVTCINYSESHLIRKYNCNYYKLDCTLILCGKNVVKQWLEELSFADELNVGCVLRNRDLCEIIPSNYDVIIVTPNFYNSLISMYDKYAWKRFIFDEAGHIKVQSMKEVISGFTWFISATPQSIIEINLRNLKSYMNRFFNGYRNISELRLQTIKSDEELLIQSFKMPETRHKYYKCYEPLFNATFGIVNNTVSEMIAAGDIKNAIEKLGGKSTDNIIDLIRNTKERELSNLKELLNNDYDFILTRDKILENIVKVENQLKEIEVRFNDLLNGECPICCDKLKEPILEPLCQNIFCTNCILTWFENKKTCPLCRSDMCIENLIHIRRNEEEKEEEKEEEEKELRLTKFEHIDNILNENEESKILLFSNYDNTFSNIKKYMKERDISFAELKGNIKSIETKIDDFKNGKIRLLFLNSVYNGAGINFQECTDIIIYHEMNENLKKQILGRANRIGRKIPLNVHYLF